MLAATRLRWPYSPCPGVSRWLLALADSRRTHRATPPWLRSGPVTHPARLASSAARCAPVPTLQRSAAGMALITRANGIGRRRTNAPFGRSYSSRSLRIALRIPRANVARNAVPIPRIPPPHIVCRPARHYVPFRPSHHARRPRAPSLPPHRTPDRRLRAVVPPSRTQLSVLRSVLPVARPMRSSLRRSTSPLRFEVITSVHIYFPRAVPVLRLSVRERSRRAAGCQATAYSADARQPLPVVRYTRPSHPQHCNVAPSCSLRKLCRSITSALWRRAFRSY